MNGVVKLFNIMSRFRSPKQPSNVPHAAKKIPPISSYAGIAAADSKPPNPIYLIKIHSNRHDKIVTLNSVHLTTNTFSDQCAEAYQWRTPNKIPRFKKSCMISWPCWITRSGLGCCRSAAIRARSAWPLSHSLSIISLSKRAVTGLASMK